MINKKAGGTFLLGKRLKQSALALLGMACAVHPAWSGDWKLEDRWNASLVLSDNIDRNDNSDAGVLFRLRPNFLLEGEGARATASVAYTPSMSVSLGGDSHSGMSHYLDAEGTAELYRNVFFISARAGAGLTSRDGFGTLGLDGIFSNGKDSNTSQTFTLSVAPELRNHFGRYADSRLVLELDTVQNLNSTSDSTGVGLGFTLDSGSYFTVLPWSFIADHQQTEFRDRTDERTQAYGQLRHRFSRKWDSRVNIGYERNDIRSDREDTDGAFWGLGFTYTPNSRTQLTVDYADRYYGGNWSAALTHTSRRSRLSLAYTRSISNARQDQLSSNGGSSGIDDLNGARMLINPVTGDRFLVIDPSGEIGITDDYLLDRVSLTHVLTGRRTSITTQFVWSQRDYESGIRQSSDVYNVRFLATRQLDQYYSLDGSFDWQRVEFANASEQDSYQLGIGINRTLGRRSSVGLRYTFWDDDDASSENRLFLTFSTSFL